VIYIIGGGGFVGSGFARYCRARGLDHRIVTRENYNSFRGTGCDVLVDASGNSRKYLSDREPLADFDRSVRQVYQTLEMISAERYVLISTGDVYNDPSSPATTRENRPIDIKNLSRYGQHKFVAEQLAMVRHPRWLIIRAGGFVGPGLRKNAVFDILSGGKVWLSPQSKLQFIHTDAAAALVMALVEQNISGEIVNLGGRGTIQLGELHAEIGSTAIFDSEAPTIIYELSLEKLGRLAPGSKIPTSRDTVRAFVAGLH
jgi:nucleoside-diphosphate-sugar epimerase